MRKSCFSKKCASGWTQNLILQMQSLLLNERWCKSFGKIESNQKAIRIRGWNPLTCACFEHPEVVRSKNPSDEDDYLKPSESDSDYSMTCNMKSNEDISNSKSCDEKNLPDLEHDLKIDVKKDLNLNVSEGYAADCVAEIFQHEVDAKDVQRKSNE